MSRNYLIDILEKFARVTTIVVETSRIKEDLDNCTESDERLTDILSRTKTQIEDLFEHATTMKELFYENYKEMTEELNMVNGKDVNENDSKENESSTNSSKNEDEMTDKTEEPKKKPVIKMVDINKLLEPKALVKQEANKQAKNTRFDDTVVLISSSESEEEAALTNTETEIPSVRTKRKAAKETLKKVSKLVQMQMRGSSSEDEELPLKTIRSKTVSSKVEVLPERSCRFKNDSQKKNQDNDEVLSDKSCSLKNDSQKKNLDKDEILPEKSCRLKNGSQKKNLDEVTLRDSSSSSSSSDNESLSSIVRQSKHKKRNYKIVEVNKEFDWKNDPKINSKCYVKLLRVPCEKLKEYYLEKLELLEINKLRNISSLKQKRRRSSSDTSSSVCKKKSKRKSLSGSENGKQKSEDEDSDSTNDGLLEDNDNISGPLPEVNKSVEEMADDVLHLLNSDKEENSSGDTTDEEEQNEKSKENNAEKVENETQKPSSESMDNDKDVPEVENVTKTNDEAQECAEDAAQKEKQDISEKTSQENADGSETNEDHIESDKETNKSDKDKDDNSDKDKDDNSDKQENESEKENESDAEKDGSKKEKDKAQSSNDSEESDGKKVNKKNKTWRKDKLLTMKLTSSDSEEEFEKFRRKKDKMQEEVTSDDEPKLPMDKKKRKVKKRMRKAILSDSDSDAKKNSADDFQSESSSSSSESEKEAEKEKKREQPKLKRVKRVRDSSSEDDEEKSTRKQIRNIWGRDSLAETTKKAEAEEKERKARISEKQKKYNQVYEGASEQNSKVEKVVLDFDDKNNEELLRVDDRLVAKLKPHQASGVQFMWDACFESLERAESTKGSGCIIAHCMGLGKTLQVIALSHTLLVNWEKTKVKKILVVCPLNTVLNWVSEFKQWLPDNYDYDFEIFELVSFKQNFERQYQVKSWHENGGVLIMGYDMFRNLSNPENKRLSKKMRSVFQEALLDPGPDLVICDEGHLLKNEKTHLSIAMNRIKTLRRIVLTGTPLQNNLKEYFCMVQFIKPNLLGTYKEYLNRFVNPIINGQYTDSTPHDIQVMRRRSHVLHKMLDGVVQRRDYSVLAPYLPPKFEYVLFLTLSETQIKLYQHYMDHFARRSNDGSNRTSFLFVDFQALQRICTHPRVLLDKSREMKMVKEREEEDESEGSLKDFINDDDEDESSCSSNSSSDENNEKQPPARKRVTRAAAALAQENGESDDPIVIEDSVEKEWWQEYCDGAELDVIAHSSKLFLLFEILKECEQIGDKILVFSQSLYSLNVIEYFLEKVHDATQAGESESMGYSGSWCLGLDYFRLDGSSSCDNRSTWCKIFNDPSNTRARLFLISTKAGGLGINLVAANRVIIFDVSWNPSHDVQSIYRVYRFGQTKPCYIYRFVTQGTMEMKIYERQVTKQAISKRVVDEQQIDRHYNQNDLAELYRFEPKPDDRPTPLVPKDILLGELLQKYEDRIYKYHEHQSLLENKEEEGLNEEERKAAWEEFENEKKQRNTWSNYMPTNTMELALMSMVRKENPAWTDVQIRTLLPTLHAQLQEQVAKGDLTMYRRVQRELQIIHNIQAQKVKEQFYQQQLLQQMQQQQQQRQQLRLPNPLAFQNANWLNHYLPHGQMPGTSHTPSAAALNPSETIELND